MAAQAEKTILQRLVMVTLFAIAFAYIESTVVVYLREIFYPDGFNFPLADFRTVAGFGRFLVFEVARETATIVLMVTGCWLMAAETRRRVAYFLIIFGVWDIFYYVWLKVLLNWPASVMDWDILFLIPVTWAGPVLAPVITSLTMLVIAAALLSEKPISLTRSRGAGLFGTVLGVVVCFCTAGAGITGYEYRTYFSWPVFAILHIFIILLFFRCMIKTKERPKAGAE